MWKEPFSRVTLGGRVTVTALDRSGARVTGQTTGNHIVAKGQRLLADLLLGRSTQALETVSLGSGDAQPQAGDEALAVPVFSKPIAEADKQVIEGEDPSLIVRVDVTLGIDEPPEGDVELRELGLFDAAGELFSRALLPVPVVKTHDFSLNVRWDILIGEDQDDD
jgi:hypothetical protein